MKGGKLSKVGLRIESKMQSKNMQNRQQSNFEQVGGNTEQALKSK